MNLKGSFRFISFAAFLLIVCLLFMGSSSLATDSDLYRSPDEPVLLAGEKNQDEDAGLIGSSPTVITVNSGTDPDRHNSYTCDNNPDGLCTLRRAVIQARNTTGPVEIRFNIPTTCSSYVSSIGMWKIRFAGLSTDPATLRYLTGNITIDGTTQPGGRPSGPKIILYGANPSHDGIKLGQSQTQNGNIIRGLGFQNFKDHITITSGDNLVENCWFGLNDEGTMPYLRNGSPAQGSGVSGVVFATTARNSIVRNNYFLGLNGTASTIRGQDNEFLNNYVGTRADGKVTNPGCSTDSWLGGGGVTIQGRRHQIKNNLIAGLRFDQFYMSQPPNALQITADDITGAGHQVIGNVIGRDIDGRVVGTCGRGIYVSNHMRGTLLQDNIIDSAAQPGISINGLLYNQMEMRGNLIFGTSIEMGPQLPNGFKNYKPAAITQMSGTEIRGTSGAGSPGPNCWIEVFLDDTSSPAEAKQLLARVQADAEGRWNATIPFALTGNQGLRTTTTTVSDNTIPGALAGTTTALSDFYSINRPPRVTLAAPARNRVVARAAIVFRWNEAPRASKYQLQIRRADNNRIFRNRTLGNVLQLRQAGFPNNGTIYKWRVRAGNLGGWGPWSPYWTVRNGRPPRVSSVVTNE